MSENRIFVPRVAAVHDLSCFGRCALTVIIPALSALGAQVVPLPTALLSTHTGGFDDLYFRDLSEDMDQISAHFDRLSLSFDAIYSGFLGSEGQIRKVSDFIDRFGGEIPVLVDPVMGDDGMLYSTYTKELVEGMKQLCHKANIITPNYTEACFLTGTPYKNTSEMGQEEVLKHGETLLDGLLAFGAQKTVLTGLLSGDEILTLGHSQAGRFCHREKRLHAGYPGTGDIFASVLLGLLLANKDFQTSVCLASRFTALTMEKTMKCQSKVREGVVLEACMRELTELK